MILPGLILFVFAEMAKFPLFPSLLISPEFSRIPIPCANEIAPLVFRFITPEAELFSLGMP